MSFIKKPPDSFEGWVNSIIGANANATKNTSVFLLETATYSAILLTALIIIHCCLIRRFPEIYYPKTYLGRRHERLNLTTTNLLWKLRAMFQTPDQVVIRSCGLDAFFYLRYIRFMFGLFLVLSLIVVPILVPINVSGKRESPEHDKGLNISNATSNYTRKMLITRGTILNDSQVYNITHGLESIASQNIGNEHAKYYWLHFVMATVVAIIVCYAMFREVKYFVQIREAWLRPYNRLDKPSSGTIFVTMIPDDRLSAEELKQYYHDDIDRIWINRDIRKVTEKINERFKMIRALEEVETKFILKGKHFPSAAVVVNTNSQNELTRDSSSERVWLTDRRRPTIRISQSQNRFIAMLPFVGLKVDAIDHYRKEISRLNGEIEILRNLDLPYVDSAFIRFKNRSGANAALMVPHDPRIMRVEAFEPSYEDIIWPNLTPSYYSQKIRQIINIILVSLLILFYGIPTIIASFLSLIDIPDNRLISNLIRAITPTILLALTRFLITLTIQWFAIKQGAPTRAHVQMMMQNGQFAFLFIQVVVISSFSRASLLSLIDTAVAKPDGIFEFLASWGRIPAILSGDIPTSTVYFLSYLFFQGCFTAGDEIGQLCNGSLALWYWITTLKKTRTPREIIRINTYVPATILAMTLPLVTLCGCLVLAFSINQPLVLLVGVFYFGLAWIGQGHSFRYVKRVAGGINGTNGAMFIRALNQTFIGLYIMEIGMVGLFTDVGTRKGIDVYESKSSTIARGALMSVVALLTGGWQWYINRWMVQIGCGLYSRTWGEQEEGGEEESVQPLEKPPFWKRGSNLLRRRVKSDESGAGGIEETQEPLENAENTGENDYIPFKQGDDDTVWLPEDGLGFAEHEARLCRLAGVSAIVKAID